MVLEKFQMLEVKCLDTTLIELCLSKSPPKNIVVEDPYIETSQDEFEIPVIDWSELIPSSPAPSISLSQLPSTSTPSTVPTQILPSLSPTNVYTNLCPPLMSVPAPPPMSVPALPPMSVPIFHVKFVEKLSIQNQGLHIKDRRFVKVRLIVVTS